jgi:hypothetical protein
MNRSSQIYVSREGEAPAELNERQKKKREGEAPAEPFALAQRLPWLFNQLLWRNPAMNYNMHPRLGRSLALPSCDRLKNELFQALEGSTR